MKTTPPGDSTTLITYQPQLLVSAQEPHAAQRYPNKVMATAVASCHPSTPCRHVEVMRWHGDPHAELSIRDMGVRIEIELDADALRTLAFQLLDAAHDIEHAPKALEVAE